MSAVARDRAADRGCTGGGEVADDVGPPGEIPRGFFIVNFKFVQKCAILLTNFE
jgi:hypothetical protein